MNHAKTDAGGHKEGKKEGKPETVRMPISFGVSIQKKRSRSSFRKKSQTIRKKETGPNLWIFESEECLEVLKQ